MKVNGIDVKIGNNMKSLYESIIGNTGIGVAVIADKWVKDIFSKYADIPPYDIENIKNNIFVVFKSDETFYVNFVPIKDNIPSVIHGIYRKDMDEDDIKPYALSMMYNCEAKNIDLSHLDQSINAKNEFNNSAYIIFNQIGNTFTLSGLPKINDYAYCNIVKCPNIILKDLNNPTVDIIFADKSTDIANINNCKLNAVSFTYGQLAQYSTLMHTVYGKTTKIIYERNGKYYVFVDGIQDALNKFMANNKVNFIYYYTENNEKGSLSRCRIKLEKVNDKWAFKK